MPRERVEDRGENNLARQGEQPQSQRGNGPERPQEEERPESTSQDRGRGSHSGAPQREHLLASCRCRLIDRHLPDERSSRRHETKLEHFFRRSEENTSELQTLMRSSYPV